jgi:quinoprotein glucose dehydrogenase
LVWDSTGGGKADRAITFADGFSGMVSGVAAGVLAEGTNVWFACIPDLWRLEAANPTNPAAARTRELVHTGFGVHVAFGGHDLHGLAHGPDGRLYFSIADRGTHATNREGAVIALPDSGAVFRCEPDGRNLELYARGLRNPQELAFDADGNLWTGDNNGDGGDKARWTLVLRGADYGWTIGWQWLPKMGAWNSERLWQTAGTNTAAWLVPPVAHVGHGPAGIAYYPGTGLGPRFDDTFFMADFPGGIRTFRVARTNGWFGVVDAGPWMEDNASAQMQGKLLWDLYPVDVTFPPGGGVIVADWVEGWEKTGKGRLWLVSDPSLRGDARVAEVRRLLAEGMSGRPAAELAGLLGHADLRVRQAAQFEFAGRGAAGWDTLVAAASKSGEPRARRHAVRALRQIARTPAGAARLGSQPQPALRWLSDPDAGVVLEGCRFWSDAPLAAASGPLRALFRQVDPQVAAEALLAFAALPAAARGGEAAMADARAGLDGGRAANPWLRHAATRLLATLPSGTGNEAPGLGAEWRANPDPAIRLIALLALREAKSPSVAAFLDDADPQVVLEAARAIHDVPIPAAYGALARRIDSGLPAAAQAAFAKHRFPFTADEWRGFVYRRALNAAARLGGPDHVASLVAAAADGKLAEPLRVQALEALRDWQHPPRRDRITGLVGPRVERDAALARAALGLALPVVADHGAGPTVLVAAIDAARTLAVPGLEAFLAPLAEHADPEVRHAARNETASPADAVDRSVAGANPAEPEKLLSAGNAARGRKLFADRADWGCLRCHKLRGEGGDVGPELAGIGAKKGRPYVLESILQPNRTIAPGFESIIATRHDDTVVVGVLKEETDEALVIQSPEEGRVTVKKSELKSRDRAPSSMPDGLGELMTRSELRDLVEALSAE